MRIKGLDFLRGVAVILVIFRHATTDNVIYEIGWVGVDLFFVLSGFLIGSLVFKEYLETNNFNATLFFVRRSFKIYPIFFIFILITVAMNYIQTQQLYDWHLILNELFFIKNYRDGLWYHTWSLDVEEHFYLGFAIFIFISIKTRLIENNRVLGLVLLCILLFSTFLRFQYALENRGHYLFYTHIRIDGILIGVITAYLFHFTNLYNTFLNSKYFYFALSIILISPLLFLTTGGVLMNTIGLTSVNLGFALLVLFCLTGFEIQAPAVKFLANVPLLIFSYLGIHSYSIYVWHVMPARILALMDNSISHYFIRFFVMAIGLGLAFSYGIEKPFLRLRDKLYKRT